MTDTWARLVALIDAHDHNALALAVDDLDDGERAEVLPLLRQAARADPWTQPDWAFAIIGAGVLRDARATSRWLATRGLRDGHARDARGVVPQVLFVLTRRGVDWLPDLTDSLARRLSKDPRYHDDYADQFHLVQQLLATCGSPPPTYDGYVVAWVVQHREFDAIVGAFESDPRLAALVPAMFELDQIGARFSHDSAWPSALAELTARTIIARDVVLDACVARLGRGGKPGASAAYGHILELLNPTVPELAARAAAFTAIVRVAPSPIATAVQRGLCITDDAVGLTIEDLDESTEAGLRRKEKKLVRAQLERVAECAPDRRAPLAAVVVRVLPDLTVDLAREALAVLRTLVTTLSADEQTALRDGLAPLPRDLADVRAEILGAERTTSAHSAAELEPWRPAPLAAITSMAELTGEVARLLETWQAQTPSRLERVIEALLRWHARDSTALAAELRSAVTDEHLSRDDDGYGYGPRYLFHAVTALVAAAAGVAPTPRPDPRVGSYRYPPHACEVVVDRVDALADALRTGPSFPLSRPTWDDGHLDAAELIDRLGRAVAAGLEPCAVELEQALLRLAVPDGERRTVADACAAVGSAAGTAAATWLTLRRPVEPQLRRVRVPRRVTDYANRTTVVCDDLAISVEPTSAADGTSVLWSRLSRFDPRVPGAGQMENGAEHHLAWLAPNHRELLTAHHVRALSVALDGDNRAARLLPELAGASGTFGDASALALGYTLAGARAATKAWAVDATIILCSRNILDPALLATALVDLAAADAIVLRRVVDPLREIAAAGAARDIWRLVLAALPNWLRAPSPPSALGDLLVLAAELAERLDVHDDMDGLAEFAAGKGTSRRLVEARRLVAFLNG